MTVRKRKDGTFIFNDFPYFRPNLSPKQMFTLGSFGGTYWRPIYSSVNKTDYKNQHKEYTEFKNIDDNLLTRVEYDKSLNKYKVKVGTSLEFWESKGWIKKRDPYGWVQWYCRFFNGRRGKGDDEQIRRWIGISGENGRFKKYLIKLIKRKKAKYNDVSVSPKIRQTLQHWAYRLTLDDM